jgi:hypothetical protein
MRRRFRCDPKWITVRYTARCAEPNCQTEISSGERAFYYPSEKALYGTRCGHGEKADAILTPTASTKTAIEQSTEQSHGG